MTEELPINRILQGDVREVLKTLPDDSVDCCITSPPYYGLRDYGTAKWEGGDEGCDHSSAKEKSRYDYSLTSSPIQDGERKGTDAPKWKDICPTCGATKIDAQLGLEKTPEEYVAHMVEVFREVKRVLKPQATLWLNLGDSYAAGGNGGGTEMQDSNRGTLGLKGKAKKAPPGLKPKDLVGIPWRVAFALQQPYYTGKIKDEKDRTWLAAMVDAEGSICGTEYQNGDRTKTNIYISVTNTSVPIIEKCERLFPQEMKHVYEKSGPSERKCYRWDVERMEQKALFIREIYPHLVAKRKQAILAYTFLEMQKGLASKKKGYLAEQHEQRSWLMSSLSKLNNGIDVDLPDWVIEPPTLFEEGYYLRQDIIWAKPNPMPESVTDRCTKSHEYIFLMSKSPKYYYDAEAIKEPSVTDPDSAASMMFGSKNGKNNTSEKAHAADLGHKWEYESTRNKRSVWTITTKPFSESHFATFPEDLIVPTEGNIWELN